MRNRGAVYRGLLLAVPLVAACNVNKAALGPAVDGGPDTASAPDGKQDRAGGSPGSGGRTGAGGGPGSGGRTGAGGSVGTGGTGGIVGSGGQAGAGGVLASGGLARTGGTSGAGGVAIMGGNSGSGGVARTGGAFGSGGLRTGGTPGSGGVGTGGRIGSGGRPSSGGTIGAGGGPGSGGTPATGGMSGSGGVRGTGGSALSCAPFLGERCPTGYFCDIPTCANDAGGRCVAVPEGCLDVADPVCGCDGKTYSNDCERQRAQVRKSSDGICPLGTGGIGGSTVVTGSGGATGTGGTGGGTGTGGNPGTACGSVAGIPCPDPGQFCELAAGACLTVSDSSGVCTNVPETCPLLWSPVCGCDDKTYSNDCARQVARVSKGRDGECASALNRMP